MRIKRTVLARTGLRRDPVSDGFVPGWANLLKRTGRGLECGACGAILACSPHARPQTVLAQSSGRPNVRIVLLDGEEIHRCATGRF
jgi:hypothetical protein